MTQVSSRLFWRQSDRYVPTLSRGGVNDLPDGILELSNGNIMLKRWFEHMLPGLYRLKFDRISLDPELDRPTSSSRVVDLEWHRKSSADVPAEGLVPGLYKVRLLDRESGEYQGAEAVVLVASSEEYSKISTTFEEALTLTARWSDKVQEQTVRFFLRACLRYLATQEAH